MCTIVDVPNKGKGMRATTAIPLGTRILAESPLLRLSMKENETSIAKAIKGPETSREDIRALFYLQNDYAGSSTPLLGLVRMHSEALGPYSTATQAGIFMTADRINHSCLPNANYIWNAALEKLTAHAIRDIKSGEEITISYCYEFEPYAVRQTKLKMSAASSAFASDVRNLLRYGWPPIKYSKI
jgi:hypothetical protein